MPPQEAVQAAEAVRRLQHAVHDTDLPADLAKRLAETVDALSKEVALRGKPRPGPATDDGSAASELYANISNLGLEKNVKDLEEHGFTVVENIADPAFTAKLREVCLRLVTADPAVAGLGGTAGMLLDRDPVFVEAVTNPKLLALAEKMCGKGFLLSQVLAGVRAQGSPPLGLHSDQNWTPSPFPEQNQMFTVCWVMDKFDVAEGATLVIPGTNKLRRHPTQSESEGKVGAIPIRAEANSLACWDGNVWHGNYARTAPGHRVVLHITFSRLAMRPVEDYSHLGEEWLQGKPAVLRKLLGREDFLGKSGKHGFSPVLIYKTFEWARAKV